MQPVVEAGREEPGIRPGRARREEGGPRGVRRRVGVRNRRWQRAARRLRLRPLARHEGHGRQRKALRDARDAALPGQRDAADERRGQVVGVALERQAGREQLLRRPLGARGGEPDRDRGGRRAEPPLERDPVHESEPLASRVGEERVGPHGEVARVLGELARALSLHGDAAAVRHLELVPQVERHGRAVERGPEVRRCRGRPEDHDPLLALPAPGGAVRLCPGDRRR